MNKLLAQISETRLGRAARPVRRQSGSVSIRDSTGNEQVFDHVVLACHADQALALLDDPTDDEGTLLGAFGYTRNRAVLHRDASLMPRRRSVWASWNYLGRRGRTDQLVVTYWMNRLQGLTNAPPLFLTLNPIKSPRDRDGTCGRTFTTIHASMPTRCVRRAACGRCRASSAPGFAAPISVLDFTRTACNPALPSRSNWAASAVLGQCRTRAGA